MAHPLPFLLLLIGLLLGPQPVVLAAPQQSGPSPEAGPQPTPVAPAYPRPGSREFMRALNRAKVLARQAAERLNGGGNRYRPDDRMYGPALQSPYSYSDGYFTFRFQGGSPGWQVLGQRPARETIVSVSFNGDEVQIDYNGSPQ